MPLPIFGVGRERQGPNDLSRRDYQASEEDLRRYFLLAAEHAPGTAAKWLDRFETALGSLAIHPERFPLAPENNLVEDTIR